MWRVSGFSLSLPTKSLIAVVTWYSIRPTGVMNQRGFNHALMRPSKISSEEQPLFSDASHLELKNYLDSHC